MKADIDLYIKKGDYKNLTSDIFLLRLPKHFTRKTQHEVISKISNEFKIPFRDVKIIGSAHTGFSFVKPLGEKIIKNYDKKTSDIDIAIINKELFNTLYLESFKSTEFFKNNTEFENAQKAKLFKENLLRGYIRPDTLGCKKIRTKWLRYFRDLSSEYKMKMSAAVYFDEITFHAKLEEAYNIYEQKLEEEQSGVK